MYHLFEVAATAVNLDQVTKNIIAVSSGESWSTVSAFFVCTCCETQSAPDCRDFIPIHVSTTWPAVDLGWEDIVALHSEMDNDPKLELDSCRLDSLCDVQQFGIKMLRSVWYSLAPPSFIINRSIEKTKFNTSFPSTTTIPWWLKDHHWTLT